MIMGVSLPIIPHLAPAAIANPLLNVLLCGLVVLLSFTCTSPPRCEDGLCPSGMRCVEATGECLTDQTETEGQLPLLRGAYHLVALPGLRHAIIGYAVEQKSLVWLEQGPGGTDSTYIAGPAAGDKAGPEGERSGAVATLAGVPHVVWLRSLDQTLWYASRQAGKWHRERIDVVPPNRTGARVTIALRAGLPVVAFEDAIDGGITIVTRSSDAVWSLSSLPAPPPTRTDAATLGGTLALSGAGGGLALATYDSAGGDLVLASRGSSGWQSARFAGRDLSTGEDDGDVGLPCALARDISGELIVAWRHRTNNAVWIARSQGGEIVRRRVTDGTYSVAGRNIERRHVVGTAVDAAVRSDGRVAVAVQDASRARIMVAVETATGGFQSYQVPANGQPQVRPHLLAHVDGSLVVSWLELAPTGAGAGRLATWTLSISGDTP